MIPDPVRRAETYKITFFRPDFYESTGGPRMKYPLLTNQVEVRRKAGVKARKASSASAAVRRLLKSLDAPQTLPARKKSRGRLDKSDK